MILSFLCFKIRTILSSYNAFKFKVPFDFHLSIAFNWKIMRISLRLTESNSNFPNAHKDLK